ncbi:MAG: hypothetical protein UD936_01485 [Acutalibacteraceae bacterium]|nr:hypothetical protein [Acutalibacteraceae bacterium]
MNANTKKAIDEFIKERNEALFSLDEEKIRAYSKKYGVKLPKSEKAFWGGVYKAIYNITNAPADLKEFAKNWLLINGFSLTID